MSENLPNAIWAWATSILGPFQIAVMLIIGGAAYYKWPGQWGLLAITIGIGLLVVIGAPLLVADIKRRIDETRDWLKRGKKQNRITNSLDELDRRVLWALYDEAGVIPPSWIEPEHWKPLVTIEALVSETRTSSSCGTILHIILGIPDWLVEKMEKGDVPKPPDPEPLPADATVQQKIMHVSKEIHKLNPRRRRR